MLTPLGWIEVVTESKCEFCGHEAGGYKLCEECREYLKAGFGFVDARGVEPRKVD